MENKKAIADTIDFVVSHPESYVGISISARHSRSYEDSSVDYLIEVTEIDPDDKDMYQVLEQIEPTNCCTNKQSVSYQNEDKTIDLT